jgi:imidazolonepropionase-like amidohydrolase
VLKRITLLVALLSLALTGLVSGQGRGGAQPATPAAQSQAVLVLRGARILTAAGPAIERGVIVIEGGKIRAVGPEGSVQIPRGARVEDLTGRVVMPGIVDTHSHVGIYSRPAVPANSDGNEITGPTQPALRALDAIWPADPGIRMAQAGGVTTANIMPGSSNVVGGQTAYVKLRGNTIEEMLIPGTMGGLKMANGENPKRTYGGVDAGKSKDELYEQAQEAGVEGRSKMSKDELARALQRANDRATARARS